MATKTEIINDFKNETLTPRTTAFLLGHSKEEKEFFDSFKGNHFHHSWIISGPKGIGKSTLAYRIIRYIFSLNNQDLVKNLNLDTSLDISNIDNALFEDDNDDENYDDISTYSFSNENISSVQKNNILNTQDNSPLKLSPTHPIFERLVAGGLTDLKIIEREYTNDSKTKLKSEISVEQIRSLKEFFTKTSSEGGYKIALIDSVDEMNANSSNALLKILEEAPNKSLLILVCNNYEGLLDTIKSRCRVLKLKPLSDEIMMTLIKEYIPDITNENIKKLINLSEGSIGTALNFYNNNGIGILENFYNIIPDVLSKKNDKLINIISLIGNSDIKLQIFEKIFLTFLNNLIKLNSNVKVCFSSSEEEKITMLCHKYFCNSDKLFKVRENILLNFELTPILNLDYTSIIISCFERLKNVY